MHLKGVKPEKMVVSRPIQRFINSIYCENEHAY